MRAPLLVAFAVLTGCMEEEPSLPGEGGVRLALGADPELALVGRPVVLAANLTGAERAFFAWTFGDGTRAAGEGLVEVTRTYGVGGVYEVTVVGTPAAGPAAESRLALEVAHETRIDANLSAVPLGPAGDRSAEHALPADEGARLLVVDVRLDRADAALGGLVPSEASLRVLGDGRTLHEENRTIGATPQTIRLTLPIERGELRLVLAAEQGTVRAAGTATVRYAQ